MEVLKSFEGKTISKAELIGDTVYFTFTDGTLGQITPSVCVDGHVDIDVEISTDHYGKPTS